jgi:hypothetical protein
MMERMYTYLVTEWLSDFDYVQWKALTDPENSSSSVLLDLKPDAIVNRNFPLKLLVRTTSCYNYETRRSASEPM